MDKAARKSERQTAFGLTEEAVALIRGASVGTLVTYYVGGVPFWLALQYFTADMSHDGYASERLASGALAVAATYLWMKCWQTVYTSRLRSALLLESDSRWSAGRIYRMVLQQTAIQSWGLPVRALAVTVLLPYVWVSSFYHNATIFGDGTPREGESVAKVSWKQAFLWSRQAHFLALVLSVFTFFVWVNVLSAMLLPPLFAKEFLGMESAASRDIGAYLNTTFFMATVAVTWLCIDPIWRAAYVLRCFHGQSLRTGEDLRLRLRNAQARSLRTGAALAAFALLCLPAMGKPAPSMADAGVMQAFAEASKNGGAPTIPTGPASGAAPRPEFPSTVSQEKLNRSIDDVLARRDYTWRTPRGAGEQHTSALAAWVEDVFKMAKTAAGSVRRFFKRLREWISPSHDKESAQREWSAGQLPWKAILYMLLALGVALLARVLLRTRFGKKRQIVAAEAVVAMPDLRSDDVTADQLPEDGWLDLARQLMERGELRLALRAAYLAGLAHLGQRELVTIAKHKSNRDYDRELRRRAREREEMVAAFEVNLADFERSWYGRHEVTTDIFTRFTGNLERIRAC